VCACMVPLFEGTYELEPVLASLGRQWRMAEFSHKPFPAGRATHGGIEGVRVLRAEHGFGAADVARVEVIAPPLIVRLVGRPPRPDAGASYARLCMAYAIAKTLQHGALDLAHFRGEALADPETYVLAARVETRDDGNPDPNALAPQTVVVHLKDGRALTWRGETMLAHPARPLTQQQHLEKFDRCLAFSAEPLAPGTAERLVEAVDRLEEMADVRRLGVLSASPGSDPGR